MKRNQAGITVELFEIVGGSEVLVDTQVTDLNGNVTFTQPETGNAYRHRIKTDDPRLPNQGQFLTLQPVSNDITSGTVTINAEFDTDRTQPFTGTIGFKHMGDGTEAAPQVGDLIHLTDLKVVDRKGVGLDMSTVTYEWYDKITNTLIYSHRGFPCTLATIGKQPELRVNAQNNLGDSMTELVLELGGPVTNPSLLTDHLYEKDFVSNAIFDVSKMPVCGERMINNNAFAARVHWDYFQVWDITQTIPMITHREAYQYEWFDLEGGYIQGEHRFARFQLLAPLGLRDGFNFSAIINGDDFEIVSYAGSDGTILSVNDSIIQTYHGVNPPSAENSLYWKIVSPSNLRFTAQDSVPVDAWNFLNIWCLPDTAGQEGTGPGKFKMEVKSADVTAATPNAFEEAFTTWTDENKLNLKDSYGLSRNAPTDKFSILTGQSKVKAFMFSLPGGTLPTQAEADALLTDYDINNLTY